MNDSSPARQPIGADTPEAAVSRHRARLPRFIAAEPVGLGDVVKRMTTFVGIQPCGGCEHRAGRMNRWLRFEPRG